LVITGLFIVGSLVSCIADTYKTDTEGEAYGFTIGMTKEQVFVAVKSVYAGVARFTCKMLVRMRDMVMHGIQLNVIVNGN